MVSFGPRIFHLYGPLWIQSYGLMIVAGLVLFMYLTYRHPLRKRYLSSESFHSLIMWGIIGAFAGGRIFEVVTQWSLFSHNPIEVFYPWVGGFGILGGIIGAMVAIGLFLRSRDIAVLPVLDLLAIHAPLLQGISRIGCFFAGCCFGTASFTLPWAVIYSHPDSLAPLFVPLHPTQLYSAGFSFGLFILMINVLQHRFTLPGQLISWYLLVEGGARFIVEFWRGDQVFTDEYGLFASVANVFSVAQWLALGLMVAGAVGLWLTFQNKHPQDRT